MHEGGFAIELVGASKAFSILTESAPCLADKLYETTELSI